MQKTKYDWALIQKDYDSGMSQRELRARHGVHFKSMAMASKRGDLILRDKAEANLASVKKGRKTPTYPEGWREALSERQTLKNSGGRCKWFWVGDQHVQGTWERDAGIKLTELGIEWRKCAGKQDIIRYVFEGKERRYTPDFYLPAQDLYLEFKGYWWGDDRRKMDVVLQQKNKNIVVIEADLYRYFLTQGDIRCLLVKS